MTSWLRMIPPLADFFPPSPKAFRLLYVVFGQVLPVLELVLWTPIRKYQAMGKTSTHSRLNLPGRYAWAAAESVGPLNLMFILYTLPRRLRPLTNSTGIFGTGLPIQNELMGLLYVVHYINRAGIVPLYLAPSMSPIHATVSTAMVIFQFINSSCIACWLTYSAVPNGNQSALFSATSVIGLIMFIAGLAGNIIAETTLFNLRRGAARRKAKSEGKATITYEKVYVIPPAEGLFKYILYPHYTLEWVEWTGYYILGAAWGLGWGYSKSAALWFLINELGTMAPRARSGWEWYRDKFGARAVGGRRYVIPGLL